MSRLLPESRRWFVTGVAGFIGSHLLEALLQADQHVTGFDNFSTGHHRNLEEVRARVGPEQWGRFVMVEGDVTQAGEVEAAIPGADYVLHQAALGSVPLSIENPRGTHAANVTGHLNVLNAARAAGVHRVVYASSSAVYGDCTDQPATEERVGNPLSPYAVTKSINEQYAAVFERCYGLVSLGLRYFNVFGARQDPNGPYAAVIPRWIEALLRDHPVEIYGDGESSRDFCHVNNVVQANLVAATTDLPPEAPRVFNVGLGASTSLNALFDLLRRQVATLHPAASNARPVYRDFRSGDVRHSRADLGRLRHWLGFEPAVTIDEGILQTVRWFAGQR